MRKKRTRGATLSLVAAVAFCVIMVGVAVFFLVKLLGGARELQNAVDSGNLNVAKQALVSPTVKAGDVGASYQAVITSNFGNIADANGNFDLLVYNRLVGQAMLTAVNAASDNAELSIPPNPLGVSNAQTLIKAIADPTNGFAVALAKKLQNDSSLDSNFFNLASLATSRMVGGQVNNGPNNIGGAQKEVSWLGRGQATNVLFPANVIPSEFTNISANFTTQNEVVGHTNTGAVATLPGSNTPAEYLAGYNVINIPTVSQGQYLLCGVPLRPQQNPHLVAVADFKNAQTPIAGINVIATNSAVQPTINAIPGNAFKSAGLSENLSATTMQTLSCAVAGCVGDKGQTPAQMQCGFIAVVNGNDLSSLNTPTVAQTSGPLLVDGYGTGLSDLANTKGVNDFFSDVLMKGPVYVTGSGAFSQHLSVIQGIEAWKALNPGQPVPASGSGGYPGYNDLDGPVSGKSAAADGIGLNEQPTICTAGNTVPADPNSNSTCAVQNLAAFLEAYNQNLPGGNTNNPVDHLMALEDEKAEIINGRPSGGPVVPNLSKFPGHGICTGLKSFNYSGIDNKQPANFGGTPTIGSILANFQSLPVATSNAPATKILSQVKTRLYQINPTASTTDIDNVLSTAIPMGAKLYIYADNSKFFVTDQASAPAWLKPNLNSISPDGSTVVADTGQIGLDGVFANLNGEAGYEHPWDCGKSQGEAWTENKAIWTRSSGYNCLLGVIRFINCAFDDSSSSDGWRCPC